MNLCLYFLLLYVSTFLSFVSSQALTETQIESLCESSSITTCKQCIQAHPQCGWCSSVIGANSQSLVKRCRTYSKFQQLKNCASLERPPNQYELVQNNDLSETKKEKNATVIQIKPQRVQVNIRKGGTVKFNVTFRKVTDYPVDLYYLMDLSYSMNDDLATLKSLGRQLADNIQRNVTQNIQMGFGTFVDKVLLPFTSTVPAQLRNPCAKNTKNNQCAPPFDFRHQQQMSANLESFRKSVNGTEISGNIDTPEGMFDALMQIAVCGKEIGWRNDSSHLVVITTDAPFHMALDGKLASIFEANDMKCHLSRGANSYLPNDIVYDKSKTLDYPSIGQLRAAFARNKIQPIFAVTKEVRALYEELRLLIPNSFVDELAADSRNIISIIQTAYNQLRGRLDMTLSDHIPPEVSLTHRTLCPNATQWTSGLSCTGIKIGSEIIYEFTVTANSCPTSNPVAPLIFTSSSLQEDVKINFNFLCSCNCSSIVERNSSSCNYHGSVSCGICSCDSGYEGSRCQCTRQQSGVSLLENCKIKGKNGAEVCEGKGQCECGKCVCNDGYFKEFCQCSSRGCSANGDGVCGGPTKGMCVNCDGRATCNCTSPWTLQPSIGTCTCNLNLCKSNNETCSNRGRCDCNRCICKEPTLYTGTHCETCIKPACNPKPRGCLSSNRPACARCVNDVQRRKEVVEVNCRKVCNGTKYEIVRKIPDCTKCGSKCPSICSRIDSKVLAPETCKSKSVNTQCSLHYKVVWSQNDYLLLVKSFNSKQDCPQSVNVLLIVLPIVGGILLAGIIALIVWKIFQTMRDKREWLNFENEMKNSKWTKGQNPIFEKPSTRFENPTFDT